MTKVVWSEGMLLTQQHMQQFELNLQQESKQIYAIINHFNYGFFHCSFDHAQLELGVLMINSFKCLTQDYRLLEYDMDKSPVELCIDLKAYHGQKIRISLYQKADLSINGLSGYTDKAQPAWVNEYHNIKDVHDANREQEIALCMPNFSLLVEECRLDKQSYDSAPGLILPMIEIDVHLMDYQINPLYIAPSIRIDAFGHAKPLMASCLAKLCDLEKKEIDNGPLRAEVAECKYKFLQAKHPEVIYHSFIRIAAILSVQTQERYRTLYQQNKIAVVFKDFVEYLDKVMSSMDKPIEVQLEFSKTESGYFRLCLQENVLDKENIYVAAVLEEGFSWQEKFTHELKICSEEDLEPALISALPGLLTQWVSDPDDIKEKIHHPFNHLVYFKIQKTGQLFDRLRQSKNLAVYHPRPFMFHKMYLNTSIQ